MAEPPPPQPPPVSTPNLSSRPAVVTERVNPIIEKYLEFIEFATAEAIKSPADAKDFKQRVNVESFVKLQQSMTPPETSIVLSFKRANGENIEKYTTRLIDELKAITVIVYGTCNESKITNLRRLARFIAYGSRSKPSKKTNPKYETENYIRVETPKVLLDLVGGDDPSVSDLKEWYSKIIAVQARIAWDVDDGDAGTVAATAHLSTTYTQRLHNALERIIEVKSVIREYALPEPDLRQLPIYEPSKDATTGIITWKDPKANDEDVTSLVESRINKRPEFAAMLKEHTMREYGPGSLKATAPNGIYLLVMTVPDMPPEYSLQVYVGEAKNGTLSRWFSGDKGSSHAARIKNAFSGAFIPNNGCTLVEALLALAYASLAPNQRLSDHAFLLAVDAMPPKKSDGDPAPVDNMHYVQGILIGKQGFNSTVVTNGLNCKDSIEGDDVEKKNPKKNLKKKT